MRYPDVFRDRQPWVKNHRGTPFMGLSRAVSTGNLQVTANASGDMRAIAVDFGGKQFVVTDTDHPLDVKTTATYESATATGFGSGADYGLHISPIPKTHTAHVGTTGAFVTGRVSATGTSVSARRFRKGLLMVDFGPVTGTPNQINVAVQFSDDNATWYSFEGGAFAVASGTITHSAIAIGTGLAQCWGFDTTSEFLRVKVTTTGVQANKGFYINGCRVTMKS